LTLHQVGFKNEIIQDIKLRRVFYSSADNFSYALQLAIGRWQNPALGIFHKK